MAANDPFARRRGRLMKLLRKEKLDSLLVTNSRNLFYLSGFRGEDSALLLGGGGAHLITDSRFTEQAGQETRRIRIVTRRKGLMRAAAEVARRAGVGRLGIRDNFFDLGGDSLAAVRMLRAVESRTGLSLSPTVLLDAPTVELLAEELRRRGCTGPLPSRAGGWRGLRRLFGT